MWHTKYALAVPVNLGLGFDFRLCSEDVVRSFDICLVNIKTMRKIVQIFVAFSEKLSFMYLPIQNMYLTANIFESGPMPTP